MTYDEQLKIEQLNKEIIDNIYNTVPAETFIEYYLSHNQKETCNQFGLRNTKQLTKILKLFKYDFSKPKPSRFKGKPAARSHESYLTGGKKSAETQKTNWACKSDEEKEAWSIKQSAAHLNSPTFKDKITASNRAYRASLSDEERKLMDKARSESMKSYWDSLSEEEKQKLLDNRFSVGSTYSSKDSKPNLLFKQKLEAVGLIEGQDFKRELCLDHKLFDFVLWNKIAIEIDPAVTHNSTWTPFAYNKPLDKNYHKNKSIIAAKYGLRCIHIFDWDNQEKLISVISNHKNTVYGRNCEIKEVQKSEAQEFINLYHLQGYARDSIRLGLYYNDELVSIMTFGKPRYNKKYEYELIRYCAKYNVVGGAEKLFKCFVKQHQPGSIISYCDTSKFTGETYDKLDFKLLKLNSPSRHWFHLKTHEHYLDSLIRQHGFSRIIHKTESDNDNVSSNNNVELMLNAGFVEVYDCGQAVYVWSRN